MIVTADTPAPFTELSKGVTLGPTVEPTLAWAHDSGADLAKTNVNDGRDRRSVIRSAPAEHAS
jgi:hypothetical protein